ncbi:IS2 repressor TnpA [Klebsiella pneumoniae]|nr:IS2 repressor TnpA [Klebsiella pneumoniae]
MSNTNANFEMTGILLGQEARKRKTPQEKIAIIQQTMEPGMNVSHVARLHGIQPSLLFKWKKQYQEGSLTAVAAGEEVVPASELTAALKQVRELQRLLGKKTMEVEILKEAVEYGDSYSGQPSVIHTTTSKADSRLRRRSSVARVRSPKTCATTVLRILSYA